MRNSQVRKTALAGIMVAVAVVGSIFSFPVLGSRCAPVQHLVNIICAVFLGPWYAVAVAFLAVPTYRTGERRVSDRELLEMSDWSSLEQESFNLSSQLNCGWQDEPAVRSSKG